MHPDLTPEEVYSACDAVMEAHHLPRAAVRGHAVWKHLGRGGKGTVEKYTKEWREMPDINPRDDQLTLASVITSIEQSIGILLEQGVNAEVSRSKAMEAELAAEMVPLKEALVSAHMKIDELLKEITKLRDINEALECSKQEIDRERVFLEQKFYNLKENFTDTVNALASLASAGIETDEQEKAIRKMVDQLRGIPTTDRKGNPKKY